MLYYATKADRTLDATAHIMTFPITGSPKKPTGNGAGVFSRRQRACERYLAGSSVTLTVGMSRFGRREATQSRSSAKLECSL